MAEDFIGAAEELAAIGADLNRNDQSAQALATALENLATSVTEQVTTATDLVEPIEGKASAANGLAADLTTIRDQYLALADSKAEQASAAYDEACLIEGVMENAKTQLDLVIEKLEAAAQLLSDAGEEAVSLSGFITEGQAAAEQGLTALNDA